MYSIPVTSYRIFLFFILLSIKKNLVKELTSSVERKIKKIFPVAVQTEGLFLDEGQQRRRPNRTLQKSNQ